MQPTLTDIENAIERMEQGKFHELCDALMVSKGYKGRYSKGRMIGRPTSRRGTPDTILAQSGNYIFLECTTQKSNITRKAESDIRKDLNESKTGIAVERIEAIYYFWSRDELSPDKVDELAKIPAQHGVKFKFFGNRAIADEIYNNYRHLAESYLGIRFGPQEICDLAGFLAHYRQSINGMSLDNDFCLREEEAETLSDSIVANRIAIISGPSGVGKTKLAVHVLSCHHDAFDNIVCIRASKTLSALDVECSLSSTHSTLVFIDDANIMNDLPSVIETILRNDRAKIVLTVRDYVLEDVVRQVKRAAFVLWCSGEVRVLEIERFNAYDLSYILEESMHLYDIRARNAITRIANGNARLAVMACEVFKKTGNLDDIVDASDIYEWFYAEIADAAFCKEGLLAAASMVSAMQPIIANPDLIPSGFLAIFDHTRESFQEALCALEELEVICIAKNSIVHFADQSMRSYVAKRAFINEEVMPLSNLIVHAYNSEIDNRLVDARIVDLALDFAAVFGGGSSMVKLKTQVLEAFRILDDDDPDLVKTRLKLCALNPEWCVRYARHRIKTMPETGNVGRIYYAWNPSFGIEEKLITRLTFLRSQNAISQGKYVSVWRAIVDISQIFIREIYTANSLRYYYNVLLGEICCRGIEKGLIEDACDIEEIIANINAEEADLLQQSFGIVNLFKTLSKTAFQEEAFGVIADYCEKDPTVIDDVSNAIVELLLFENEASYLPRITLWLDGLKDSIVGRQIIARVSSGILRLDLLYRDEVSERRTIPKCLTDGEPCIGREGIWQLLVSLDGAEYADTIRYVLRAYASYVIWEESVSDLVACYDLPFVEELSEKWLQLDLADDAAIAMVLEQSLDWVIKIDASSPLCKWRETDYAPHLLIFGAVYDLIDRRSVDNRIDSLALNSTVRSVEKTFHSFVACKSIAVMDAFERMRSFVDALAKRGDRHDSIARICEIILSDHSEIDGLEYLVSNLVSAIGADKAYSMICRAPLKLREKWLFEYFTSLPASQISDSDVERLLAFASSVGQWRWSQMTRQGMTEEMRQLPRTGHVRLDMKSFKEFEKAYPGTLAKMAKRVLADGNPTAIVALAGGFLACKDVEEADEAIAWFSEDKELLIEFICASIDGSSLRGLGPKTSVLTRLVEKGSLTLWGLMERYEIDRDSRGKPDNLCKQICAIWQLECHRAQAEGLLDWLGGMQSFERPDLSGFFAARYAEQHRRCFQWACDYVAKYSFDEDKMIVLFEQLLGLFDYEYAELISILASNNENLTLFKRVFLSTTRSSFNDMESDELERVFSAAEKVEEKLRLIGLHEHCMHARSVSDQLEDVIRANQQKRLLYWRGNE